MTTAIRGRQNYCCERALQQSLIDTKANGLQDDQFAELTFVVVLPPSVVVTCMTIPGPENGGYV